MTDEAQSTQPDDDVADDPMALVATGDPAGASPIDAPVPAAGERLVVVVPPGATFVLADLAFDPQQAVYAVDGGDLVVTLANGGVLVLRDFFASGEAPAQLGVLGGPAVTATELLARAEAAPSADDLSKIEPAAGAEGQTVGGGADFSPYDQGAIGPGLDPLGPLGPTFIGFGAGLAEGDFFGFASNPSGGGPIDDPGGGSQPPTVTLRPDVDGRVVEEFGAPFDPPSKPALPILGDGLRIPDAAVNGVDQRNLTLDAEREVTIAFLSDTSRSIDTLFVYHIDPDGNLVQVQLALPYLNQPGGPLPGPEIAPGTEVSLGRVPAGTQLGLLMVNDAGLTYPEILEAGGRYELRSTGGGAANINDGSPPRLWHIADDGTETLIEGLLAFTADAMPDDPLGNALNTGGVGRTVSGWDEATGTLIVGFEDGAAPRPPDHPFYTSGLDFDFDDGVVAVRFGPAIEKKLVLDDFEGGFEARISDPDSSEMAATTIVLETGLAGDRLVLDPAVLAGTGITIVEATGSRIELAGRAAIADYENALNSITFEIDLDDPQAGQRTVAVTVTDLDGNSSDPARVTFDVTLPDGDAVSAGEGALAFSDVLDDDLAAGDEPFATPAVDHDFASALPPFDPAHLLTPADSTPVAG